MRETRFDEKLQYFVNNLWGKKVKKSDRKFLNSNFILYDFPRFIMLQYNYNCY